MDERGSTRNEVGHSSLEGIRMGRRRMLQGSAAAAAGFLLGQFARAGFENEDEFFERWQQLATRLLEDSAIEEEEYVRELSRDITLLPLQRVPRRTEVRFDEAGLRTGPAWMAGPIFIVEITMEPGSVVRPHNHPSHNSVTVGLEGHCTYAHYELHGDAPPAEKGTPSFTVRETRAGVLTTGRMAELTRSRDNIHTFHAGDDGATILDFTTTVGGGSSRFSVLEIDENPKDARGRLFEARWVGNPYR